VIVMLAGPSSRARLAAVKGETACLVCF